MQQMSEASTRQGFGQIIGVAATAGTRSARARWQARAAAAGAALLMWPALAGAFGFADVARLASERAARPHQALPEQTRLQGMSYDDYRQLRFRPEQALWHDAGLPFQVHFYPLGRSHTRPLVMHEVVDGRVQPIEVPARAFRNDAPNGPPALPGAAGWRYHFALNQPGRPDELMVFLGASYFRVLSAGLHYGLSARGLAIDTTGGGIEEFPAFTHFWLVRPAPGAGEARFYALLDSPRATGAYAFTVRPGNRSGSATTVDIQAQVHLRGPVRLLGIAPLTSMFLAGENQPAAQDYRPEVHDSDGLQLASGDGEWLWRPLVNPAGVFVSAFEVKQLRGFGLMQRDRQFSRYEDLEAHYEQRPSAWVEPLGDWGPGRVELLQFHAADETHDNIGAYWVPARRPEPGTPLSLAWRLHVGGADLAQPPGAWVVQSRLGHGYREAMRPLPRQQFHIDFQGPALQGLGEGQVEAVASSPANARELRAIAQPHGVSGGWRVTLDFERIDSRQATELRLFLRSGARVLSETWAHALPPEP
jgi:periplasmic glucans biosynthesis protein